MRLVLRSHFKLKRQPKIGRIIRDKFAPDHPHNLIRLLIELNSVADDAPISAKSPLPQAVTEHNHIPSVWAVFGSGKSPSCNHRRTQDRKIIGAYMHTLDLFRLIAARQVQSGASAVVRGSLPKDARLLPPDIELGHVRAGERPLIAGVHQMHERLRIRIGERLEQNRINDREDGGIRADPDRNHKNREDRESRSLQQRSHRKANVAPGRFK